MPKSQPKEKYDYITIWDGFTRIWHWSTVFLVLAMWATAEFRQMQLHSVLGILLTALFAFRITLGLWGASTVRFSGLVTRPEKYVSYLKTVFSATYKPPAGHSPIGALSAIALLLALACQILTGLFSVDVDGMNSGPLARFVSFAWGRSAADFHEAAFNFLVGLIILHLLAILFYTCIKRANLIGPMLTGRRSAATTHSESKSATLPSMMCILASVAVSVGVGTILYIL